MMAPAQPIIQVSDLTAAYGEVMVIDDISFEVYPGEILVILGGSGSGKSTVLKHMIGLYEPVAGSIVIEGDDIVVAEGAVRQRILRKIGVMYQFGALFGSMTLHENVRLPLEEFTDLPEEALERVACMKLSLVGLEAFAGYAPDEISGGMRKRAALARAMALDPKILFLDEPSAGLDPVTSAGLDALILGLARSLKITFVVVTHELASIYAIADRVIMLDGMKIVAAGTPAELRDGSENPWVRQFFHREAAHEHKGQ